MLTTQIRSPRYFSPPHQQPPGIEPIKLQKFKSDNPPPSQNWLNQKQSLIAEDSHAQLYEPIRQLRQKKFSQPQVREVRSKHKESVTTCTTNPQEAHGLNPNFDRAVPVTQKFTNAQAMQGENLLCQPSTDKEEEGPSSFEPAAVAENSASMLDKQGMLTFGNFG